MPGYKGSPGMPGRGKSLTVPDQALTIPEIAKRHRRGVPTGVSELSGEYFGVEIPPLHDLTDLDDYRRELKERMTVFEETLSAELQEIAEKREMEKRKSVEAQDPVEASDVD